MRINSVDFWNIQGYLCYSGNYDVGVLEYWSNGVLALEAEIDQNFALLMFV